MKSDIMKYTLQLIEKHNDTIFNIDVETYDKEDKRKFEHNTLEEIKQLISSKYECIETIIIMINKDELCQKFEKRAYYIKIDCFIEIHFLN